MSSLRNNNYENDIEMTSPSYGHDPSQPPDDVNKYVIDYDVNVTSSHATPPLPERTEIAYVKTAVLLTMFILSVVGNAATLAQLYRTRRRKSTINLLIFHLATADLLVACFCNVTEGVWMMTVQWYSGNVSCKLVKFAQVRWTPLCQSLYLAF